MLHYFETVQAMPVTRIVKRVRLMVCMIFASSMTLTFIQGHTCVSNVTNLKKEWQSVIMPVFSATYQRGSWTPVCSGVVSPRLLP